MIRTALLVTPVAGLVLLALPVHPDARAIGMIVALVSISILAVIGLPRRLDPYPVARAFYTGSYPPLPDRRWATVTAQPEGLTVNFGRRNGQWVFKYGRLEQTMVTHTGDGGQRAMFAYYRDLVARCAYPVWFIPADPLDADRLVCAVLRRNYEGADLPWKIWRTHAIDLTVTGEELRNGAEKLVSFQRKVACSMCAGIEGITPSCRECSGKGSRLEDDRATVRIPRRSRAKREITIDEMGHEDINGYRGPLVVTLVRNDADHAPRP